MNKTKLYYYTLKTLESTLLEYTKLYYLNTTFHIQDQCKLCNVLCSDLIELEIVCIRALTKGKREIV